MNTEKTTRRENPKMVMQKSQTSWIFFGHGPSKISMPEAFIVMFDNFPVTNLSEVDQVVLCITSSHNHKQNHSQSAVLFEMFIFIILLSIKCTKHTLQHLLINTDTRGKKQENKIQSAQTLKAFQFYRTPRNTSGFLI